MRNDNLSGIRMLLGGLWFLLNDTWKSQLRFSAMIAYSGKVHRFHFEDIGDFELLNEIFLQSAYLLHTELEQNPVIIDLGANIGVATIFFAMCWPNSEIHSVEPDPKNFRRLFINTKSLNNIVCHQKLIWSHDKKVPFYVNKHRGSSSSILKTSPKQHHINFQASTLSQFIHQISKDKISLLKIDVEGAEEAIFSKFHEFDKIKVIAGELHHDYCDTKPLIDILKKHYNQTQFYPLKMERDYFIAKN
jgi:FkbM family methyltransferase